MLFCGSASASVLPGLPEHQRSSVVIKARVLWEKCELLLQGSLDVAPHWQSTEGGLCWILKSDSSRPRKVASQHNAKLWLFTSWYLCHHPSYRLKFQIFCFGMSTSKTMSHSGTVVWLLELCRTKPFSVFLFPVFFFWLHYGIISALKFIENSKGKSHEGVTCLSLMASCCDVMSRLFLSFSFLKNLLCVHVCMCLHARTHMPYVEHK